MKHVFTLSVLGLVLASTFPSGNRSGRVFSKPLAALNTELPKPTGSFTVGTVIYNWTDVTRDDIVTEAPDDKRQITVQVWYPSQSEQGAQRAPYMPELTILRSVFKQGADQLEKIQTNSFLQTKLSNSQHKYPVIIFSHGMGVPRSWYTMLMEELASQGYVVAGIDHPYMGLVAMNGKVVKPYPGWTEPPAGGLSNATDEVRDKYWRPGFEQLSADQRFTFDQLTKLNSQDPDRRFTKRLDLKRVGMMGHSMGFVSETCGVDLRFTACLNLEGVPQMNERRSGFRQPYMTMRDGDDSPRMTTIYTATRNVAYDVLIKGAGHNSYQDSLLAAGYKYKLDVSRGHQIINAYMLAFFNTYLKGHKSLLLDKTSRDFPEVEFKVYRPAHKK